MHRRDPQSIDEPRLFVEISVLDPKVEPVDQTLALGADVIGAAREGCTALGLTPE